MVLKDAVFILPPKDEPLTFKRLFTYDSIVIKGENGKYHVEVYEEDGYFEISFHEIKPDGEFEEAGVFSPEYPETDLGDLSYIEYIVLFHARNNEWPSP